MRARVGEARSDARELERRLEDALAQRVAVEVVVREARDPLVEPYAGERLAAALVLGDEDPAVIDEGVAGVALLDQQAEPVAGARVGGEIEVRGEDVDQPEHQAGRLTGLLDRVEERPLHDAAHGLDTQVGDRLGPADAPATLRGAGGEREPGARLVADLHRLAPDVPGDLDRGAGPDLPEIGAILRELRGKEGR